jgi:hypothetical protein
MRHPLSGVEPEVVRSALLEMASNREREFPALLSGLQDIFRSHYPPHILAVVGGYGLQAGVGADGVSDKSLIPAIEQHHIELLQALILALPESEWGEAPAESGNIQFTIDSVVKLAEAYFQRRFLAVQNAANQQQRTVLALQERLRIHTQVTRNWGHFLQVVAMSTELYQPFDEALRAVHGFGATDLITLARDMTSLLEERHTERMRLLRRIFREHKIRRIVRLYFRDYPGTKGDPEEFIRQIPPHATVEMVMRYLLMDADITLPVLCVFSVQELGERTGLDPAVAENVLATLAVKPGALHAVDPEHFFLGNPVWKAPLMAVGGDYFCVMPQAILSHIHDILSPLIAAAGLRNKLEARRAAYLEDKAAALLKQAMPAAEFRRNVKWEVEAAEYETDLIAKLDRTVIIVEAKSGSLSARGLRGAPERVQRHVRDLILSPSDQSARLENLVRDASAGGTDALRILAPFGMEFRGVDQVVRISVTMEDFSVLASAERELRDAGWIPNDAALAPAVNIADFECVVDILPRPALFVHYFMERDRFQKAVEVLGFEMDFLGLYLATGFNTGDLEDGQPHLSIIGMSSVIDKYYTSLYAGVTLEKPAPRHQAYFKRLIDQIEEKAFPGWLRASVDLLRLADYDEQADIVRAIESLRDTVRRTWRDPNHRCSVMVCPPHIRETAAVFFVLPAVLMEKRRELVENLLMQVREFTDRSRCVVVGRCIEHWDDAFSFIFVAQTPKT